MYSSEISSALTKLSTCYSVPATFLCACHCILKCLYVWKRRNTMWLVNVTCAWLARLFGTTPNHEWVKDRKMYAQSVCICVPMPEWNRVCSYFLYGHVWMHCSDMLSCPDLRLKTASSSSWRGSGSFLLEKLVYSVAVIITQGPRFRHWAAFLLPGKVSTNHDWTSTRWHHFWSCVYNLQLISQQFAVRCGDCHRPVVLWTTSPELIHGSWVGSGLQDLWVRVQPQCSVTLASAVVTHC